MNSSEVLRILFNNKEGRNFPDRQDPRYHDGFITPTFKPKFGVDFREVSSVFTIGSCFARNIEEHLMALGVNLPTTKFLAPEKEWSGGRSNSLLNEYNPGSICQKIIQSLEHTESSELTICQHNKLYYDMLLPKANGVEHSRVLMRRNDISDVYEGLINSEVVIITLGYVEAWYDNLAGCWLNRMPLPQSSKDTKRFSFKRLDVDECMPMLLEALDLLASKNIKIILTVSPVPLRTTMIDSDCIVANEFSKSVLRVCAERLKKEISNVDYYPSYEMVRTSGLSSFKEDNIHVHDSVVGKITKHMIEKYLQAS